MSRTVLIKGNPFAVDGDQLKVGDKAPDFHLKPDKSLADYAGKTLILSVLPSVDTGPCSIMTKRFNEEAAGLPDSIKVLTVSTDLPAAQTRFCGAEGTNAIEFASDHMDVSFGLAYGVLMPHNRLLARSVFVVGPDGLLKHVEYVPDIVDQPDFEGALGAAKATFGVIA